MLRSLALSFLCAVVLVASGTHEIDAAIGDSSRVGQVASVARPARGDDFAANTTAHSDASPPGYDGRAYFKPA